MTEAPSRPLTPEEAAGLLALSRELLAGPVAEDAFGRILRHALAALPGAQGGSVAVRGDDGRFRFVAACGHELEALRSAAPDLAAPPADADGRAVVVREPGHGGGARRPDDPARPTAGEPIASGGLDRVRASVRAAAVIDGEAVAALRLDAFDDAGAFDEHARVLAEAYAGQLAWVVGRWRAEASAAREARAYRRLYADAAQRARAYEVLDRLRQAVARGRDLDEILRLTVHAVAEALEVPMVSIFLTEEGGLRLRHAAGYQRPLASLRLDQGITGRVAATGVPVLLNDVASDPDYVSPQERVVSALAVPLVADDEVLGVLSAESGTRVFGEDDLRLLSAIRDQVGVALQRARLWASVQASEARFRLLAENARDLICLHAPDGRYTYVSPSSAELIGYRPCELIGRSPLELVEESDHALLDATLTAQRATGVARPPAAYRARAKDGHLLWLETSVRSIFGPDGGLEALVTISRDVSERRSFEERLQRAALYDDLTGLPNRALLLDRLEHVFERHRRHPEARYAVLFVDIDRFKVFNDSLGHAVGDALLQALATRMRDTVRAADTVARLGGDEFCVLLEQLEGDDEAERTGARLQEALAQPFALAGRELFTTASIGIAKAREGYAVASDVLRDADIAMYHAKEGGEGRLAVFDLNMRAEAVARLELETALRRAVAQEQLDVAYQPVVRLADGAVVGFEALARWTDPERGPVAPDLFVPLAEETGLIVAIDRFVARRACRAMARWRAAGRDWKLSVNVSSHHFTVGDVVAGTQAALRESGLDPRALRLEITESVLMAHPDRAWEALVRLRGLGTMVQVDDYGTGYSSLAYLLRLPIDALKLDRSFVAGAADGARAVVTAVVQLARQLGIEVVAEGIETPAQADWLSGLGCRLGQGFLYAAPLREDEVPAWAEGRATAG